MKTIIVNEWAQDYESGIFPIGARDKQMLWAPEDADPPLKPSWPYLFKESIRSYPDQFWAEVVACIVARHLDVEVPTVHPAERVNDGQLVSGALIEWMYEPSSELLIHAGDLLKSVITNFDSKQGKHHNLDDMSMLLRAVAQRTEFSGNTQDWVCDMALFDALIGNTDRHQENWGFIYRADNRLSMRISPLYDNGTSLGHERFTNRVQDWSDERVDVYISKGMHHLRFNRDELDKRIHLLRLVDLTCNSRTRSRDRALSQLKHLDMPTMSA